jgi:chromosome segregation protein
MYIKEIKIKGFKSFSDKFNLELNENFTGIVGPNGSGKSNIVDAIKWVLGEQSIKNLRGSKEMIDVIFDGSSSREPANSASVTIVFDNTDKLLPIEYNEVAIKRIVYRNGENEYYLNNERCRLKDISDLLVDSFSSRDSFNIVQQGKIDDILSDKPENRRIIFEEAAGVLKYKKRKEESLKKLDRTHENLEKVDMIISEINRQLIPLKEASEKASEYQELTNKLSSIEIALIHTDITNFNTEYEKICHEKETYENENIKVETILSKDQTDLEKLKLDLSKIEENISKYQIKLNDASDKLTDLSIKKDLLNERIKYDKDNKITKNNLSILKENELKIINDLKINRLDKENIQNDIEKHNKLLSVINTDLTNYSKNRNNYSNEIDNITRKLIVLESKKEVLENSILNNDKVPYSVKNIINNHSLGGILGIIGSIIKTEDNYSLMLDTALGAASNFVIVENEESAKNAIKYLKDNNKGRVTFFPLNVIKPKMVEPELLDNVIKQKGFIGLACDLVNYDKKFYNIIMNQLGSIIVADNLENAINISRLIKHRYKIVTLSGEIIHMGGSLTGGSQKQNSSISDRNELNKVKSLIEEYTIKLKQTNNKLDDIDAEITKLKNNAYMQTKESIKFSELLNVKIITIKDLENELDKISIEIKTLSSSGDVLNKESNKLLEDYYNLQNEKEELSKKIEYLKKEKNDLNDLITEKESIIKKNNQKTNEYISKINSLEIEKVKCGMNLDSLLNKLNEEYSITYEAATCKYDLDIEIDEARKIVIELKNRIKLLGNINLESIKEYEKVNERYTFLESQRNDLMLSEEDLLKIINEMDEVMIQNFKEVFDKINVEFNKVFHILFNGGKAELKLTDPNNLLETGIEIIACPPGKKYKSLSLLSGGERALIAVCLLFAIMNIKQVPFVIFDEVESALDEVNVDKFGQYLSHYKGKTQLLIITHKKRTMEYVDLLYGITMQESGVSKLVSVRLEDIK